MLIRRAPRLRDCEVTDEALYLDRRAFIASAAAGLALGASEAGAAPPPQPAPLAAARNAAFSLADKPTKYEAATTYNNFYEFGTEKDDPARLAHTLRPRPWTLRVEGHVQKARTFDIDELLRLLPLEERVYALRCVEGWSMVIPWVGFSLGSLLKLVVPTGSARFVEFTTLQDPEQFPAQKKGWLDFSSIEWPYLEGLRLDEALHPLVLLTVGMYGRALPNQNGAPVRLVVPWKYGFYSNVNPTVDHPRWSQATERRIGEFQRRKTLMFNGYADQVASLYAGMDLRSNY